MENKARREELKRERMKKDAPDVHIVHRRVHLHPAADDYQKVFSVQHRGHKFLVITKLLTEPAGMTGKRKGRAKKKIDTKRDNPEEEYFWAQDGVFVELIRQKMRDAHFRDDFSHRKYPREERREARMKGRIKRENGK